MKGLCQQDLPISQAGSPNGEALPRYGFGPKSLHFMLIVELVNALLAIGYHSSNCEIGN